MSFVKPLIENTNSDVRDLAYTIVAQICINEGESYTSEYTNSIRDAQKEILLKKITNFGGAKSAKKVSIKSEKANAKQSKDTPQKPKSKPVEKESRPPSKNDKPTKTQKVKKTAFLDDAIQDDSEKNTLKKTKKSNSELSNEECLFCEKFIQIKGQDSLEKHYAEECLYLVKCPQCGLLVEIIHLQTHMYGDCEQAPSDPKSVILKSKLLVRSLPFTNSICRLYVASI